MYVLYHIFTLYFVQRIFVRNYVRVLCNIYEIYLVYTVNENLFEIIQIFCNEILVREYLFGRV